MSTPDITAHFHAGTNDPGYLPESEPAAFATWDEARRYIIGEMLFDADSVASWNEPHDCDDIPCPTFGDDCPEGKASALTFEAEDLNLCNGPEYGSVTAGRSYWIVQCSEPNCDTNDYEPEASSPDIWQLLEQAAPKGCEAVQDLYSWSLNYDAGKGPFGLFLDLTGWSQDNYGSDVYDFAARTLGYVELSKVAAALEAYSVTPATVHEYVSVLMEAA